MGDPATLVESATPSVVTAVPTVIAGEMQDGTKTQAASKNGKKSDSGSSGSGSFFTWFIVLALLGVWTSVAVVYFDLVDYQGVLGKLVAYDTDGDGDFDVEDAKVLLAKQSGVHEERKRSKHRVQPELSEPRFRRRERTKAGTRGTKYLAGMRSASLGLDEKPGDAARGAKKGTFPTKDAGLKLREALKQQLAIIHERVEAKKLARLALAEVRQLLAKEEEEKELELGRKEITAKVKERVAARLKVEEEKIEKEEMEKALEKLRKEKAKHPDEKKEEKEGEKKSKKEGEKEEKSEREVEGKKAQEEDKGRGKEKEKGKKSKSERGGKN